MECRPDRFRPADPQRLRLKLSKRFRECFPEDVLLLPFDRGVVDVAIQIVK